MSVEVVTALGTVLTEHAGVEKFGVTPADGLELDVRRVFIHGT